MTSPPAETATDACAAGQACVDRGDLAAAAEHFRRATVLDPASVLAHRNLGATEFLRSRFFDAEAAYEEALRLNPSIRSANLNLAAIQSFTGRREAAVARLRDLLARNGHVSELFSSYLYTLTHSSHVSRDEVFAEHVRFGESAAAGLAPAAAHGQAPDPDRRLKLGYVSADVGPHILALMLEPLLRTHDRSGFEVFLYDNAADDERRAFPRHCVDHWIEVGDLDDAAFAARVRANRIDVLVDLSGHTTGNRLLAFARKPAPVQVSWLGYPFTTGLRAVDYRICDARQIGPGTASLLVEEPFIVPGASVAFAPPDDPAPAPPPGAANGYVTFGSMNGLDKVDDAVLALWAEILRAVPGSRLLMKARGLQDERLRQHMAGRFANHGITPDRLAFEGASGLKAFLESFSRIDIALDAFPYTGGSTTRYTLWMGVPLVTLEGVALYERFSGAILREMDLPGLAATDTAGYVAAAVALAGDPARLAALRRDLRPRMRASALYDVAGQTRRLEEAYREMWRRWCASTHRQEP